METASPVYSAAQALRTGGRDAVRAALLAARKRTLVLADAYAEALRPAGLRVPCRATLNPPLWEWGHVAWFQEWWIARNRERALGTRCDPEHERLPSLMAASDALYDSGKVAHATRWDLPLPDEKGTRAWMAATMDSTLDALEGLPADAGDNELYFFRLVALHEEMHAEAACYMARGLGIVVPTVRPTPLLGNGATLHVPAQEFVAGWQGPGFAFDNELAPVRVQLAAFEIDAEPVSQARFSEFADAGGYVERKWWGDAGWAWLQQSGASPQAGDAGAPAMHLTAFEAEAWCRWAGRRLPKEFEWECAALTQPDFRWGHVWEWTASPFVSYPGFEPHPYRDYSAPWFGTRRTLRGACAATSPRLAHPRYRNFFEPQRSDIVSGFRSCA
ncbi:selenoneine synthase SenA [Ramlibacter sp. PS4R-6]|uniref:selenoneine synthase SenA n=1 Tax=Ramlibacter sp. PS4R-6 TaxID=3133438 RepID=UPI0030B5A941